jgi:hypothetical protein
MKGSILIDKLIEENGFIQDSNKDQTYTGIKNEDSGLVYWYIAKPEKMRGILEKINRLKAAWLVLTDKAFAVHYKEDEKRIKNVGRTKYPE